MQASLVVNKPIYVEQIKRIQRGLNGSYTKEQIDLLFEKLKRYKIKHLITTIEHLITVNTFLPPIDKIIIGCRVEAYGDELKENQEEKEFSKDFFEGKRGFKGEIAKESLQLIFAALHDDRKKRISKKELYGKMLDMDVKYPGKGWKTEAEILMDRSLLKTMSYAQTTE